MNTYRYNTNVREGEMSADTTLWEHSELARKFDGSEFVLGKIIDWEDHYDGFRLSDGSEIDITYVEGAMSFHPNGRCGCINVADDYIYGIRCDHLIWMDGWFEGCLSPGILLIGNHKGCNIMSALIFYKEKMFKNIENYEL